MIDVNRLSYIKNVSNDRGWVYKEHPISSYFLLHFSRKDLGADNHALRLPKGSLLILSQKPPDNYRYLTHVVELVNDGIEDKPLWEMERWRNDPFGIVRWVKVLWTPPNFDDLSTIPIDGDVMQAPHMLIGTKAKLLENCADLMTRWGDMNSLRAHLGSVFN